MIEKEQLKQFFQLRGQTLRQLNEPGLLSPYFVLKW